MLVEIDGMKFRIGQIIADLEIDYNQLFSEVKKEGVTDKHAKAEVDRMITTKYGKSSKHFERLHEDMDSLVKSLKYRINVLSREM